MFKKNLTDSSSNSYIKHWATSLVIRKDFSKDFFLLFLCKKKSDQTHVVAQIYFGDFDLNEFQSIKSVVASTHVSALLVK